jgi:hypothetical protein
MLNGSMYRATPSEAASHDGDKSFLRVGASGDRIHIRCFAPTGCRDQEDHPPIEDELVAERWSDGRWTWREAGR